MTNENLTNVLPEDYEFNLSDFAFFLSVMKNPIAYENTLSIILNEMDLQLCDVKVEQVILNKSGKRAIRLDAWAMDKTNRQFNMEMQNDTSHDDVRKRSRFYQGLHLNDGTQKIFLNMSSENGAPELVSLLQYMKDTRLDNPKITVKDERILKLDSIVSETRESEEWEAVKMNILEIGIEKGREDGIKEKQLDIARNLLDVLSDDVIAEKTGLDIEVVKKLRQEENE